MFLELTKQNGDDRYKETHEQPNVNGQEDDQK
jgi:hypothetical protein